SLFAGDKVEFVLTENDETVMRPITKRVDDVFGKLYKQGRTAVSIEEMNAVVKKRAQKSVP
ncbi:MAG: AbrB family transcriptional regulator, partial [Chloroflexi bacterium]|nr:AbrB family transcriptional regulator [Chloroflexota bacterium]